MPFVPAPGLVLVMLTPIVAAGLIALPLRERYAAATPMRALWLVTAVVAATVVAARLQDTGAADDSVVNRVLACGVLVACGGFLHANRHQPSRLVLTGVVLTALGAAANALASLIYGYMPVLASSARWLGMDVTVGGRPNPQYVGTSVFDVPALLLGDVLPVPGPDLVVSLGDLLLIPGCTLLLAAVLAGLFVPVPSESRKEVTG